MMMWGISRRKDFEKRVLPELEGLMQTCLCLTGSNAEADRLLQETVSETYRLWDTVRHQFGGRAPVYSVLTEQYLKSLPAGSRLNFFYPSGDDDESLTGDLIASITSSRSMARDNIMREVSCLPPVTRLVIVLSLVQGFSRAEIGDIIGVPVEVAADWLYQGHRRLRRELLTFSSGNVTGAGAQTEYQPREQLVEPAGMMNKQVGSHT